MILDEFFKPNSTANLAEGLGDFRPTLGSKRDQGKSVRKWRRDRGLGEQNMDNDNLQGGRSDDEVKFFIDSEPAYYAVMDRFGDHIEFRGDDLVAPQRLWSAIQQTAGDAGGAADIAGLEDDRMGTDDELDEQGVAEGSAADGSVNYTLGHTPDAEYVYSIYRDGKKEGTYHSVAQAREIMGNMKLTSPNREYKIERGARNKMAGPASQLPEQGMPKGHGNYAGDRPVNLGGVSMKKIQIGDTVRYIDQKAQVIDMSRDRERARITIPSSATTKTVLTSDLRQLGRGVQEAGYDSGDYSNDRHSDDYGRDLVPTGSGGSRFVNHGAHDHTRGRPAKTHGFSKNLPADPFGRTAGKIPSSARPKQELDPFRELDELSPATLARYKTKAGAAATAADSAGDRKTGDRRFSGIVKATKKQFDQDAKQSAQAVHESRLRLMASIIKTQ